MEGVEGVEVKEVMEDNLRELQLRHVNDRSKLPASRILPAHY